MASETLKWLRKGFAEPNFQAIEEWHNSRGTLGVYEVDIPDDLGRGTSQFVYVALRTVDGQTMHWQYVARARSTALLDAHAIAEWAGVWHQAKDGEHADDARP